MCCAMLIIKEAKEKIFRENVSTRLWPGQAQCWDSLVKYSVVRVFRGC